MDIKAIKEQAERLEAEAKKLEAEAKELRNEINRQHSAWRAEHGNTSWTADGTWTIEREANGLFFRVLFEPSAAMLATFRQEMELFGSAMNEPKPRCSVRYIVAGGVLEHVSGGDILLGRKDGKYFSSFDPFKLTAKEIESLAANVVPDSLKK